MAKTSIEWCDFTFNPWRGCAKVSAGCANCYADAMSKRNPGVFGVWGTDGTRVIASESAWREPLKWNRAAEKAGERRRVFCASMADVFEDRPELIEPRYRLFSLIDATPHLDWLLLTKRPERAAHWFHLGWETPPGNVWVGVSVENQDAADERIPIMLQIPATVRFLSCEPLLGPVDLTQIPVGDAPPGWLINSLRGVADICRAQFGGVRRINWVIAGGESGPQARPCEVAWIASLVEQCQAAGVACFVKQDSGRYPGQQGRIPDDLWNVKEFPQ